MYMYIMKFNGTTIGRELPPILGHGHMVPEKTKQIYKNILLILPH